MGVSVSLSGPRMVMNEFESHMVAGAVGVWCLFESRMVMNVFESRMVARAVA